MKIFKLINFELKKLLNLKKILVILIILLLSSFGMIKFGEYLYNRANGLIVVNNSGSSDVENKRKAQIEQAKKAYEEEPTANNLYIVRNLEGMLESYKMLEELNPDFNDWRYALFNLINSLENSEIPLKMYLDGVDMSDFTISEFYYDSREEVEAIIEITETKKQELLEILQNGKYYDYVKILLENEKTSLEAIESDIELLMPNAKLPNYLSVRRVHDLTTEKNVSIDTIKLYNYIIDNKIEDHKDWRYLVIHDIIYNLYREHQILDTEEELNYNPNAGVGYLSYEEYLSSSSGTLEESKVRNQENRYYLDNNIKPLTIAVGGGAIPYNTRLAMNNIYYMAIVSLIITIIISGGIVANEHKSGSIRLLLTKPYKRYKVLLSKLIVMILMFITLYFISGIITYLLSGIMYGFSDFSIPLLVNQNTTVSYFVFTLKNAILAAIISLLFLNILFALSSITLSTSTSLAIILILIFILTFLPYTVVFSSSFNYIPLILLNFNQVLYPTFNAFVNININNSIIYSIVYSLIILLITFIIYCKRDIKN